MRSLIVFLATAVSLIAAGLASAQPKLETAVFAGGCFWCTEADFEKMPGVVSAVSGYTGGSERNPTYEQVVAKRTGHLEAVRVTYDPSKVTYGALVTQFWRTIDPTDAGGQFCDRGATYRTAVFVSDPAQRRAAEASKALTQKRLGKPVVTEIRTLGRFWPAEGYHQDYARKNPLRYKVYRQGCGRDARLKGLWAGR
ncbi:MAG TPA: peptide-methionine (S)-S-oxide reductase MsrA [Caulobacteraceae bacterium]|jgi:peptide-methionine (S)-S-oxide reductase